ncbi:hypothetical protein ZEAMMB73_Zm00001d039129 [Zea mays]|jgi:hypothetical protein|uniref:Uncharacterized protein n=1 Tax=Zea mays TaxID=4577 RepID=A0A1D6MDQ6_MAIZE|nr:hypothetical protein ZEAMMB73_Zm00001d039129 [Zea mays]|eukprot:XP_020395260.1 subtilisin-like protease SBT4.11 [Zea mays]
MASFRFGLATTFLLLAVLSLHSTMGETEVPRASFAHEPKEDPAAYRRTYIVFVSPPVNADAMSRSAHRQWHESFLPTTTEQLTDESGSTGDTRLVGSYTAVFHGFAARLTEAELSAVAKQPGFLRALPDRKLELFTTRTRRSSGLAGTSTGSGATPATAAESSSALWTRGSTASMSLSATTGSRSHQPGGTGPAQALKKTPAGALASSSDPSPSSEVTTPPTTALATARTSQGTSSKVRHSLAA